jgi:cell division protein FtsA
MNYLITGLDVGSYKVRAVMAAFRPAPRNGDKDPLSWLQIIGTGSSEGNGVRRGIVVDIGDVAQAIRQAINQAQHIGGFSSKQVIAGINGAHLESKPSQGVVAVARADREITKSDVERAVRAAEAISTSQNREIIQVIARSFNIDSEKGIQNPVGMSGVRLEVNGLVITVASPFLKNLVKSVERAGLEVDELAPGPLAAAEAVLNKKQKELGVMVLDLGAETTSLAVYEEGEVVHLKVIPAGSNLITSDIAIGIRTDLDTAESVKIKYGSALPESIRKTETVDLSELGLDEKIRVRRQEIANIIEARLKEFFALVNQELGLVGRRGFLPAGVVLVGGGAKLPGVLELAKNELELPVQIGFPRELKGLIDRVTDPAYVKAVGLVIWGLGQILEKQRSGQLPPDNFFYRGQQSIRSFFRNLLP